MPTPNPEPAPSAPARSSTDLWERLLDAAPMMLRALLGELRLRSFEDGVGVIACPAAVRGVAAMKLGDLGTLASTLTGAPVRFELVEIADDEPREASNAGAARSSADEQQQAVAPEDAAEHPLVREALDVFGARIVEVKPIARDRPEGT